MRKSEKTENIWEERKEKKKLLAEPVPTIYRRNAKTQGILSEQRADFSLGKESGSHKKRTKNDKGNHQKML